MYMKNFVSILVICSIVFLSGCGLKTENQAYETKLDIWGVFDNTSAYNEILLAYRSINDNVSNVNYRKYTIDSYKEDLLNALASGTGPDIFMIHNSWFPDFQDKIEPIPEYMMSEQDFRYNFVDVVADDFVLDGKMYGVPLSVDSLALYYNKDIFNAAGVTQPPKTWDEFDEVVKKLTNIDEFGNIDQSAAAIGTAFNVNRSTDILTAMMIQNSAEMSDPTTKRVTFAEPVQKDGKAVVPGEQALKYYTDFASAVEPVYTWNKNQNYSIDEFFEGNAAMMINYSWHYDTIEAKNAKLNFAVADLPQVSFDTIGEQANFANYWTFVVAKNKQPTQPSSKDARPITNEMRIHEAWQLLIAMTFPSEKGILLTNGLNKEALIFQTKFDFTKKYLEETGKPAARRDLVQEQVDDVRLGSFARGNLIAQTWWRNSAIAVDAIFAEMIDSVNTGKSSVHDAVDLGARRTQQLMK